jgi:hypothetical protein
MGLPFPHDVHHGSSCEGKRPRKFASTDMQCTPSVNVKLSCKADAGSNIRTTTTSTATATTSEREFVTSNDKPRKVAYIYITDN